MPVEDPKEKSNDQEAQIYELGYLFVPTIGEENVLRESGNIKEVLGTLKAVSISDGPSKLIDLAYEMEKVIGNKKRKFTRGYFGWIKFELVKELLSRLKEALEQNENILRFLIIKTVRESTLASPKIAKPSVLRRKKVVTVEKEKEPKEKISKEEIDKKIEELVVD